MLFHLPRFFFIKETVMNETIRTLLSRRSIRSYTTQQISDSDLNWILEAGIYAATSRNMQSWFLTAVQNPALLKKLRDAACEILLKSDDERNREKARDPNFSPFYNAPTLIIVSGNKSGNARIDCANATQNMCVAANALGLGSCYLASFTMAFKDPNIATSLLKELGIPDDYFPQFGVALGYASEKPEAPYRKKDVIRIIK